MGTGAIFNMRSHVLLNMSGHSGLNALHESLHFISGVSYALALLLFPTGKLPPSPFPNLHLPPIWIGLSESGCCWGFRFVDGSSC